MAKLDYEEIKSGLSDSDFERIGEVIEKQDVYSRSSRKYWIAKLWIPKLVNFICASMILITLFAGYSFWHHYNKPVPLIFYEYPDGAIHCARPYLIENGKKIYRFSDKQKETCIALKKFV